MPRIAWELDGPVFMEDSGKGDRFLRVEAALQVGINRGFTIPCATPKAEHFVMAFLSTLGTAIARRCELWAPDTTAPGVRCVGGFCEVDGRVDAARAGLCSLPAIPILRDGRLTAVVALYF